MIRFANPGLIELAAVTTMGVSVKAPGSFGRFGTGLKYAIASVLREGGHIHMWRGGQLYEFMTREQLIRGRAFRVVHMCWLDADAQGYETPMGYTTELGRHWEPWMVLRELACNATDEGGSWSVLDESVDLQAFWQAPQAEETVFYVWGWPALEAVAAAPGDVFASGDLLAEDSGVRAYPGPSRYVFYRGVRAYKLPTPSYLTWDIKAEQFLTEDRTLYGTWELARMAASVLLSAEHPKVLEAVTGGRGFYEGDLDFDSRELRTQPSRAFLDAVITARARKAPGLTKSAVARLQRVERESAPEERAYSSARYRDTHLSAAIGELMDRHLWPEDESVYPVEELPEGVDSMAEGGRVYVRRSWLDRATVAEIASELARRYVDLRYPSKEDAAAYLLSLVMGDLYVPEGAQEPTRTVGEAEAVFLSML